MITLVGSVPVMLNLQFIDGLFLATDARVEISVTFDEGEVAANCERRTLFCPLYVTVNIPCPSAVAKCPPLATLLNAPARVVWVVRMVNVSLDAGMKPLIKRTTRF